MNKKELERALERIGMHPGKLLGQNFMLDANLPEYIVRAAGVGTGDFVLEVGPGFGALTRPLLAAGCRVTAVEFDHRIAAYLREELGGTPDFQLTEDDACRVDFKAILPMQGDFFAVANLPYSISSIFIARMTELDNKPRSMTFMLQKEMGERLAAVPGTKNYGSLSVRIQLYYEVKILRQVPPDVFYPQPEVDSAIVQFVLRADAPSETAARYLPGIVRTVFAQRRKQLGKTLGSVYGKAVALAALERCRIPANERPERLSVSDFSRLAHALFPGTDGGESDANL
ncbi:MAG: 16S rRNA (adenine(1518)-N(6)/adenine(1519)-N(6))-dimethyltransferase RsmA [Victivallaceae bacterium]|nr:16S rRNA (adenine(1518)-N(6)/adenine(1519)-N(6))-dimethyltransferase RsmA [Victivallaceae bacterium]